MSNTLCIGVAGGTGSGKTTVADRIVDSVGADRIVLLHQDRYYRDLSHVAPPQYPFTRALRPSPHRGKASSGPHTQARLRRAATVDAETNLTSETSFAVNAYVVGSARKACTRCSALWRMFM